MELDSYSRPGVRVAVDLVNGLVVRPAPSPLAAITEILAFDPSSTDVLGSADAPGFLDLARTLHAVFAALDSRDVDGAARSLNALLAAYPAHPHLAREEDGRWSVHHHPVAAGLVPSWTAICAESLARIIGEGGASRLGLCEAPDCRRAYVDTTRNGSRRFCSTTCQNRLKAAAFRRRRAGA